MSWVEVGRITPPREGNFVSLRFNDNDFKDDVRVGENLNFVDNDDDDDDGEKTQLIDHHHNLHNYTL